MLVGIVVLFGYCRLFDLLLLNFLRSFCVLFIMFLFILIVICKSFILGVILMEKFDGNDIMIVLLLVEFCLIDIFVKFCFLLKYLMEWFKYVLFCSIIVMLRFFGWDLLKSICVVLLVFVFMVKFEKIVVLDSLFLVVWGCNVFLCKCSKLLSVWIKI